MARSLWLFYSNNTPESAAFLDEFFQLAGVYPSFHFVPTMTALVASGRQWNGATGLITQDMLCALSRMTVVTDRPDAGTRSAVRSSPQTLCSVHCSTFQMLRRARPDSCRTDVRT